MKRYIFLLVSILFIGFILFICCNENNTHEYSEKINLIKKSYKANIETEQKNSENTIAIVSISDIKTKAIVKSKIGSSFDDAIKLLNEEINSYIDKNNYDVEWVKLDIIKDVKQISLEELKNEISNLKYQNTYRNGIVLTYDDRDIILTEAELNSNGIIDYANCEIDINKLNDYLKSFDFNEINEIPDKIKRFETTSYFCDEYNNVYELSNEGVNTGIRKNEQINIEEINKTVTNARDYLSNLIQDNGKFIYGFNTIEDSEIEGYNILRHSGSLWSLIACYDENCNEQKAKVDKALGFLNRQVRKKDDTTYFIIDENNEIKLGGNALTIIALCEYTEKFGDSQYIEIAKKLGNGIIDMQYSNGRYKHILNANNFSTRKEFQTVYYDGEATFALCKLYGLTKETKYLDAARKAIKYFIENNYTKYCDHWIEYSMNEITKYIGSKEYYEFGLKNVIDNIDILNSTDVVIPTQFELLMQGYELYNRMKKNNVNTNNIITEEKLIEIIENKAKFQLNSYLYPEISMYLSNPSKYYNTFFARERGFEIRIDDIQHSIMGYHYYLEIFNKK